jgi:hypothetical protein
LLTAGFTARVAVHVQAIIEKFPHDTLISFAHPAELSETTLSSSTSLLKHSASITSSNSSLRRRRLAEIAEETGDQGSITDQETVKEDKRDTLTPANYRGEITAGYDTELPQRRPGELGGSLKLSTDLTRPRGLSTSSKNIERGLPVTSGEKITSAEGRSSVDKPAEDRLLDGRPSVEGRPSSQFVRPTTRDLHEGTLYTPKVKLGPRPSLDYSRTQVSSPGSRSKEPRPISTLPASVKVPTPKPVTERPPSSHIYSRPKFIDNARMPRPFPAISKVPPSSADRPTSKAGSIASISTFAYTSDAKPPAITPEKQRLMKAMQLRKKQMEKKKVDEIPPPSPTKLCTDYDGGIAEEHSNSLKGIEDGSGSEVGSDVVRVGLQDHRHSQNAEPNVSPISLPDASEGPSTNASSVAETEESPEEERIPDQARSTSLMSPGEGMLSNTEGVSHKSEPTSEPQTTPIGPAIENLVNKGPESEGGKFIQGNESHEDPSATDMRHEVDIPSQAPEKEDSQLRTQELPDSNTHQAEAIAATSHTNPLTPSISKSLSANSFFPTQLPLPAADEAEEAYLQETPTSPIQIANKPDAAVPSAVANTSKEHEEDKEHNLSKIHNNRTRSSTLKSNDVQHPEPKARQRKAVEPIRIVSTAEQSEENFLADESFMEELQSATVQEAMPISVSRSPITPVLPMSPRSISITRSSDAFRLPRTSSNPLDTGSPQKQNAPRPDTANPTARSPSELKQIEAINARRAVSSPVDKGNGQGYRPMSPMSNTFAFRSLSGSPTTLEQNEQTSAALPKKTGVGSLISQRIKALEKMSGSGSQAPSPTATLTPPLVHTRKGSFTTPSGTSSPLESPQEGSKWGFRKIAPYPTPSPSPQGTIISRKFGSTTQRKAPPESISVAAGVVGESPRLLPSKSIEALESTQSSPRNSPLIAQRQFSPNPARRTPLSKPGSVKSPSDSPTSPEARRPSIVSNKSNSSRRGSVDRPPPPLSRSSSDGRASVDGPKEEKKESRKSRLFKRLSGLTSSSRRNIAQTLGPSVKEEPGDEWHEPETPTSPTNVDFGDLNVQFPDTLVS